MGNDLPDYTPAEAQNAEHSVESPEMEAETAAHIALPAESDAQAETLSPADQEATEHFTSATEVEAAMEDVEPTKSTAGQETIQLNLSPLITLVVGLGLGFLAGFAGRPYLLARSQPALLAGGRVASSSVTVATPPSAPSPGEAKSDEAPVPPTPAPASAPNTSPEDAAARRAAAQRLMEMLIAQTRHFKGDPNAPVTMIEFSDFQ